MNLYFRLIRVLLGSLFDQDLHYSTTVRSRFRVWPHDLDAFGHMNNGRYLQIMDVARADWMFRTGVMAAIRRNRWSAILGGGFIRYRYSLRILQVYSVRTQLICWDRRWFFFEHAFIDSRGRCVAKGISRAALRAAGRWVSAEQVAAEVHPEAESPTIPAHVTGWLELEEEMFGFGVEGASESFTSDFVRKAT